MAIDMTVGGDERLPNYIKTGVWTCIVDFAEVLIAKGSALAAADIIEVLTIPAGCAIECACVSPVTVVNAEATVCILDLGDGTNPDMFVDGFDAESTTEGVPIMTVEKFYPAADTLDLTIQALTGVLSTGKVKISAKIFELTV